MKGEGGLPPLQLCFDLPLLRHDEICRSLHSYLLKRIQRHPRLIISVLPTPPSSDITTPLKCAEIPVRFKDESSRDEVAGRCLGLATPRVPTPAPAPPPPYVTKYTCQLLTLIELLELRFGESDSPFRTLQGYSVVSACVGFGFLKIFAPVEGVGCRAHRRSPNSLLGSGVALVIAYRKILLSFLDRISFIIFCATAIARTTGAYLVGVGSLLAAINSIPTTAEEIEKQEFYFRGLGGREFACARIRADIQLPPPYTVTNDEKVAGKFLIDFLKRAEGKDKEVSQFALHPTVRDAFSPPPQMYLRHISSLFLTPIQQLLPFVILLAVLLSLSVLCVLPLPPGSFSLIFVKEGGSGVTTLLCPSASLSFQTLPPLIYSRVAQTLATFILIDILPRLLGSGAPSSVSWVLGLALSLVFVTPDPGAAGLTPASVIFFNSRPPFLATSWIILLLSPLALASLIQCVLKYLLRSGRAPDPYTFGKRMEKNILAPVLIQLVYLGLAPWQPHLPFIHSFSCWIDEGERGSEGGRELIPAEMLLWGQQERAGGTKIPGSPPAYADFWKNLRFAKSLANFLLLQFAGIKLLPPSLLPLWTVGSTIVFRGNSRPPSPFAQPLADLEDSSSWTFFSIFSSRLDRQTLYERFFDWRWSASAVSEDGDEERAEDGRQEGGVGRSEEPDKSDVLHVSPSLTSQLFSECPDSVLPTLRHDSSIELRERGGGSGVSEFYFINRFIGKWELIKVRSDPMESVSKAMGVSWVIAKAIEKFTPVCVYRREGRELLTISQLLPFNMTKEVRLFLDGKPHGDTDSDLGSWTTTTNVEEGRELIISKRYKNDGTLFLTESRSINQEKGDDVMAHVLNYFVEVRERETGPVVASSRRLFRRVEPPPPGLRYSRSLREKVSEQLSEEERGSESSPRLRLLSSFEELPLYLCPPPPTSSDSSHSVNSRPPPYAYCRPPSSAYALRYSRPPSSRTLVLNLEPCRR